MKSPTHHDELREMAAAYALGALSPADDAAFEAHASGCDECAAEVRAFGPAVVALAQLAPEHEPPDQLRSAIVERVGGPREAPFPRPAGAGTVVRERSSATPLGPWLLAAASVLLGIALGGYSLRLRDRVSALEERVRDATSRADAAVREVAGLRQTAANANTVVVVLASPDLVRVDLAGQAVAPAAMARAFWSRSHGLVFSAANLPPLPAGRTYQLWIVTAESPIGAGLMKPGSDGGVQAVFSTPTNLMKPVAIAVTIEPDGGVPAPTGDKYLVGLVN